MADQSLEGAQAFGSLSDSIRKNSAFNALTHVYGPGGGAVQEMQADISGKQSKADLEAAQAGQAQALTEGERQKTKFEVSDHQRLGMYRTLTALEDSVDPATGSVDPDAFDRVVGPNADALGFESPEHVAQVKKALTSPGGAAHINSIRSALIGPTKITGAPAYSTGPNGESLVTHYDQYGNPETSMLQGRGVQQQRAATGEENAQTSIGRLDLSKLSQKERAAYDLIKGKIAQQNANTSARGEDLRANNSVFGQSGGGPSAAPPGPAAGPGAGNPQAPGGVTGAPGTVAPLFNSLPPKGRQAAIGQAQQIVNQKNNLATVNSLLDQVDKQISPWTAGAGSMLAALPGGTQKDLKANLATLKAQGLTAWIQSMKNAQGQTGIGRVLQSEANAAMNLYGNMEQDQSAKQLAYHAQLFRKAVNNLYKTAQSGFKTMYGSEPEAIVGLDNSGGGAPAAPGGAAPAAKLSDQDLLKQYGVK